MAEFCSSASKQLGIGQHRPPGPFPPRVVDERLATEYLAMARPDRRKSKPKKAKHSQRMNHLKAMALNKFARHAWDYDDRYKSITLLNEALRRDPTNPEIIVNLAMACGKQRHYERAEELLSRLLELRRARPASIAASLKPMPDRSTGAGRRMLSPIFGTEPRNISHRADTAGSGHTLRATSSVRRGHTVVAEALAREPDRRRPIAEGDSRPPPA